MKSNKAVYASLFLLSLCLIATGSARQAKRKTAHIFLDIRETNLDKPSTVATNTLSERLAAAGFRVTTNRRDADLVVDGTISARPSPVTDEVKREGGVNADATASLRLLSGAEVIATSVERSGPGDWGVQAERVGEDRLIEVAGRVADDMFSGDFVTEVCGREVGQSTKPRAKPDAKPDSRPVRTARKQAGPKRGVTFLEVASLVQNFAPEDRIVAALRKYGIKFKPRDVAINQLRALGATEAVISAVKTSTVV